MVELIKFLNFLSCVQFVQIARVGFCSSWSGHTLSIAKKRWGRERGLYWNNFCFCNWSLESSSSSEDSGSNGVAGRSPPSLLQVADLVKPHPFQKHIVLSTHLVSLNSGSKLIDVTVYCRIYRNSTVSSFLSKLGQHTFHSLRCIRITWGIIKMKTSDSFLQGFFIIEGQFHWDPHQNYCWCDALSR